ncbi:MAG TPA: hypothetical protein VFK48_10870 [Usitatibacter sp.]|nr:hypothetical protein [Usitatibacter sp.]
MTRALRAAAAAAALALCAAVHAGELRNDVGSNDSPLYEKECGGCHFPYQAGWLPERSWRKLMGSLASHFGENAEIAAGPREAITTYLASHAADRSTNLRSQEILAAIPKGDTPISVTKVLYVGGIHGGFLDPAFKGKPEAKTLAQCPLCHQKAHRGWFAAVNYTITDESFRTDEIDDTVSMPAPAFMRLKKR